MMLRARDFLSAEYPDLEFKHILEFQREGIPDREWIPKYADDWILISTDRNKGTSSKAFGGNLPALCQQLGMTHVLLGAAVHRLKQFEKATALLSVWDDLVEAVSAAPRGARFIIRKLNDRFVIEPRPKPSPPTSPGISRTNE